MLSLSGKRTEEVEVFRAGVQVVGVAAGRLAEDECAGYAFPVALVVHYIFLGNGKGLNLRFRVKAGPEPKKNK